MNVRLYPAGDVHETASSTLTTCGMTRAASRDWLPTDDSITCRSCVRRKAEREAAEATEFAL